MNLPRIGSTALAIVGAIGVVIASSADGLRPLLPLAAGVGLAGSIWAWRGSESSLAWILGVAIVLRMMMLGIGTGALSDDIYRYIWDGAQTAGGGDPYLRTPNQEFANMGMHGYSNVLAEMNSANYYSVYPPVSQYLFAGAVWFGKFELHFIAIRLIFALCELGALFLLARMVPARALILYAWNPLVLLETWGQTHTEAALLFALATMLFCIRKRWFLAASGALTMAIWIKLWPVLLLPFVLRQAGWRVRDFVVIASLTILVWLKFWSPVAAPHMLESLRLYMHTFEFNAGFYYVAKGIASAFIYGLDSIPDHDPRPLLGIVSRIVMLGGLAWVFWLGKTWSIERQIAAVVMICLLTLPTVHPWYLLPPLFMLPLFDRVDWSWIWLGGCTLGTYLLYTHGPTWYWGFVVAGWAGWIAWKVRQSRDNIAPI